MEEGDEADKLRVMKQGVLLLLFILSFSVARPQLAGYPAFITPDTVCVGQEVNINSPGVASQTGLVVEKDGTFKGAPCPPETYTHIAWYSSLEELGTNCQSKGNVILVR
jgi:hypothetical protein